MIARSQTALSGLTRSIGGANIRKERRETGRMETSMKTLRLPILDFERSLQVETKGLTATVSRPPK